MVFHIFIAEVLGSNPIQAQFFFQTALINHVFISFYDISCIYFYSSSGTINLIFHRLQFLVALTAVCAADGVNLLQMYLIGHLDLDPHPPPARDHRQILVEQVSYL